MAATALRPQNNFVVIAPTPKEAAYGTAVIDASITKLYPLAQPTMAELTKTRVDDKEQIKGHEFPMDTAQQTVLTQETTFPLAFPASSETAGFLFAQALGAIVEAPGSPNVHTITAQNGATSDQLPSTSIVIGTRGQTGTYKKYKGCIPNDVKFTCDSRGRCGLSATYFSDGTEADASAFSVPATVSSTTPLWGKNASMLMGDAGAGTTDYSSLLRSFDVTWTNNLDRADNQSLIAAGTTLTGLRFATRSCALTIKLWGSIADIFYATDFSGDVLKNIILAVTNTANDNITFSFSRCIIESIKPSFDNIRNVLELTIKPFVITASTGISPVSIVVKNSLAAYLA